MRTIAALIVGTSRQAAHRSELAGIATVRCTDTIVELVRLVTAGGIDAVVTELRDRRNDPVPPLLAALPEPRAPTLLLVTPDAVAFGEVRDALATSVYAGCVVRGQRSLGGALDRMLASPGTVDSETRLVDGFIPLVGDPVRGIITALALAASPALRVRRLAEWFGLSERALRDRFTAAALPSPSTVHHYFVTLRAAGLLAVHGWTMKRAAAELGFRRVEDLRQLLRDYAELSPAVIGTPHGFATLSWHVASVLRGSIPPRDGRRRHQPSAATRRWCRRADAGRGYVAPAATCSTHRPPWLDGTRA